MTTDTSGDNQRFSAVIPAARRAISRIRTMSADLQSIIALADALQEFDGLTAALAERRLALEAVSMACAAKERELGDLSDQLVAAGAEARRQRERTRRSKRGARRQDCGPIIHQGQNRRHPREGSPVSAIDATAETEPAATGIGTDTTGGPVAPPPASPAPTEHDGAGDTDLDLLSDEGEEGADDGEPGADAADADADAGRRAWQRPDGIEGDALANWKEQQGLPTDPDGYSIDLELGEGQTITETGQQLINGLKEFAVEHDLPPPAVSKLAQWYDDQVKAQQAKLAEADKALRVETKATLQEQWGSAYASRIEFAREGARVLPAALRQALRGARTADGRSIDNLPEFAIALYEIGKLRSRKGPTVPTTDEERLAHVVKVMNTDVDKYRRDGLDKEHLDIMRRRDASGLTRTPGTLTAAEAQEEAALTELMNADIDKYSWRPWRASRMTGSERMLQLQRKKAGEAA